MLKRIKWGNSVDNVKSESFFQKSPFFTFSESASGEEAGVKAEDADLAVGDDGDLGSDDEDVDEFLRDASKASNAGCQLIWHGTHASRLFDGWKLHEISSEVQGRKILRDSYAEHMWDFMLRHRSKALDL